MPVNLTPAHLRCSLGGCPSVTRLDDGRLLIVGKVGHPKVAKEKLPVAIGRDETAIIISPDLLADLPEILHLREENALLKEEVLGWRESFPGYSGGKDALTLNENRRARAALTEEDKENGSGRPEASQATQGPEN